MSNHAIKIEDLNISKDLADQNERTANEST